MIDRRLPAKGAAFFSAPRRALVGCALALVVVAAPVAAEPIGDALAGQKVFAAECAACHQIGPDARNGIGPHLNDIFGRPAGADEGFSYSRPMRRMAADGLIWTLETLDAYVENPRALVSGTRMNYRGLTDADARRDVLAYLRDHSEMPSDIPEAEPTARKTDPTLSPEVLAIRGDPAWGEYLSSECTTCHLRDGSDAGIPSIVNWPEDDFVVAMHAYKQKLRPHPVMQMMAGRLSDEEIAALAAYFGALE